jgi:coenzyme PQQ synthesis protein D (PqqD)
MPYDSTREKAPFSLQLRPCPEVLSQRYDDSAVLLNLDTDRFFHLNRTGARFWELLGEGNDITQIHEAMSREFDIEGTQLADEITALITQLRAEDLVKVV